MDLQRAVDEAGGATAPGSASARLRAVLGVALRHGERELAFARSGYGAPVTVAVAAVPEGLVAVAPVAASVRADTHTIPDRAWLLVAALTGALVEASAPPPPRDAADLRLRAGELDGFLTLHLPAREGDPELVTIAFEEHVAGIDRLRSQAVAVPAAVLEASDPRRPLDPAHPLLIAEAVARLGGRPADPASVDAHEDALLAILGPAQAAAHAPHADPEPERRVARRILQRLNGMGKWGGYHTEFAHLPRGFAGNEKALAVAVGEALLAAGMLAEKPSVGQRHVFLNPRRAGEIHRMIETGEQPPNLTLPSSS